jgi:hypothetical protein
MQVGCIGDATNQNNTTDTVVTSKADTNVKSTAEKEMNAEYDKQEQELEYKTEDASYREKALKYSQYTINEENELALRQAHDTINNLSCSVYVMGTPVPDDKSVRPDKLDEIVSKLGEKHLLLLVNDKQIAVNDELIPEEMQEQMIPDQIGSFLYKDNTYLLVKFYCFSFTTVGSGKVNLLVNVNTGKVWAIETRGEVLFKSIIETIQNEVESKVN